MHKPRLLPLFQKGQTQTHSSVIIWTSYDDVNVHALDRVSLNQLYDTTKIGQTPQTQQSTLQHCFPITVKFFNSILFIQRQFTSKCRLTTLTYTVESVDAEHITDKWCHTAVQSGSPHFIHACSQVPEDNILNKHWLIVSVNLLVKC